MLKQHTITEVDRIYSTGSSPLHVMCEDFNWWVCKHGNGIGSLLFNELLAAEFAKIWCIKVPEYCLIRVRPEHVFNLEDPKIFSYVFDRDCFGSSFLPNTKEIDMTVLQMMQDNNFPYRIKNKEDFFKISLFDIWLANEDRNYNNFNLLIENQMSSAYFLYAIDHENIFNTNSLKHGIFSLTADDTILNTDLAKILFRSNHKILELMEKTIEMFYLCAPKCRERLNYIFSNSPQSWRIDENTIRKSLDNSIFSRDWLKECEELFRNFVQSFLITS